MSDTITWIRPTGTSIEIDKNFNADALKKLGWKKKSVPKPQAEAPQEVKQEADLLGGLNG